jgi:hypothetical protein
MTDKLEEQPAYNHHFEDQAGSEKSKSVSSRSGNESCYDSISSSGSEKIRP